MLLLYGILDIYECCQMIQEEMFPELTYDELEEFILLRIVFWPVSYTHLDVYKRQHQSCLQRLDVNGVLPIETLIIQRERGWTVKSGRRLLNVWSNSFRIQG